MCLNYINLDPQILKVSMIILGSPLHLHFIKINS